MQLSTTGLSCWFNDYWKWTEIVILRIACNEDLKC